jgi:hypothetical protein
LKRLGDLRDFCGYVVKKYGSPDAATEDDKAEEFRKIYLRNLPPTLTALRAVASACGVKLNTLDSEKLPKNLRGYHEVYGGKRNIYYKKNDTLSGIENTILHEIREMIEPIFTEVCPGYEPLRTIAVHLAANSFATAVLLPKNGFEKRVYETGFDVIALSELYSKSCSQVLLRMGEVLRGKLFFYAALYENDGDNELNWRVTYWTRSHNEDCPDANLYGADEYFPRKGRKVVSGSLVDRAIKTGDTQFAEQITFSDDMEDFGLAAIAQPLVFPDSNQSKVTLVVMLNSDARRLEPQVNKTNATIIERLRISLSGKELSNEDGT